MVVHFSTHYIIRDYGWSLIFVLLEEFRINHYNTISIANYLLYLLHYGFKCLAAQI